VSFVIEGSEILLVAALEDEIHQAFAAEACRKLAVGVGKVNAAARLAFAIAQRRPGLVLNVGTAGSRRFARGALVECARFVQRDMDATALGLRRGQTPFDPAGAEISHEPVFGFLPLASCGTGDGFEVGAGAAPDPGFDAGDVVDMEAYALAKTCLIAGVRFACLKYVTDGADGAASEHWQESVPLAARALHAAYARQFRGLSREPLISRSENASLPTKSSSC
jgi:adenosylhomocysteine nucleosidase